MADWRLSSSRKTNRGSTRDDSSQDELSTSPYLPESNSNKQNVDSKTINQLHEPGIAASEPAESFPGYKLESVTTLLRQPRAAENLQQDGKPSGNDQSKSMPKSVPDVSHNPISSSPVSSSPVPRSNYDDDDETIEVNSVDVSHRQDQPNPAVDPELSSRNSRQRNDDPAHSIYRRPANRPSAHRPSTDYIGKRVTARSNFDDALSSEPASTTSASSIYQRSDAARPTVDTSTVSTLAGVYQNEGAGPRIHSVRRSLDDALEGWWTENKLPSKALLRNGLLVLQAGHSLDESQRTLLLRTAMRYQRGMVTALSHQTDPDRTAYLVKEALLFEKSPLPTKILWHLLREDDDAEEWKMLLEDDLLYSLDSLSPTRHRLATAAVHQLSSNSLLTGAELDSAATIVTATSRSMNWNAGRILLFVLLIPVIIGVYSLRAQRADLTGMATIPDGTYSTGSSVFGTPENTFFVKAFAIEQTEVTNHSYRLCMQQGACSAPLEISSATRAEYFPNPRYDQFPVVNVNWLMARQYCEWAGKRLPTEVEWEIAASAAPATQRRFDYPWGNTFAPQSANSNLTDRPDTKEVGTYHPSGTSPTGATDMAGNVAEWTTPLDSIPLYRLRADQTFMVKGGSYNDSPESLRSSAGIVLAHSATEPWLGFRCAVTLPEEKEESK